MTLEQRKFVLPSPHKLKPPTAMKKLFSPLLILLFVIASFSYQACTPKTSDTISKTPEATPPPTEKTVTPPPPAPSTNIGATAPIPVDPSVRMGTLENGLKYYIQKNEKPENRAELRLAVHAGSMQEDDDQRGLAHFVEHMAFNGSENFEKNELVDYLESVGTKFGPDLNAYTSFDETVYMLQARTDDMEQLKKGLLVLEDWAGAVSFDDEEIDKERGVVESEWRSRLSAGQRMQKEYFPVLYKNSRYAERLPIGDPDIINGASYETVKRFYRDWYRPNLMAVSIVGDFDVDMMEREVVARFSKLKNPDGARERKSYSVPKHKETLISIASDKEATGTQVQLMYKHPKQKVKTIKNYRERILRSLYNQMLNARLDELSQSADPPFNFSYTGYSSDVGDIDSYTSFAFVPEGGAMRGLEVLLEENKRVLQHGFNQSELDRAKLDLMKSVERRYNERDKTESRQLVMRYVYNFLNDNPIPSPEQTLELYKNLLPTATLGEINALAPQWITDENRVVIILGPEKEETPLPTEGDILTALEKADQMNTAPYEDKVSDEPLLAKTLSPVAISNEKTIADVNVTEFTLANGVKVVLKPTDFKNDEIRMTAFSDGGSSLYNDEDYIHASNASSLVNESGVSNFDNTMLQKMLAGKSLSVYPYIGELTEGINGFATPDDIQTMMELTYLYFTAPRKDEKALQSYVAKQKAFFKNVMSNPNAYFQNEAMKIKYQDHPRRQFPTAEDYDKIDLDRAFEIYQERFADASDFTFIFVGNLDMEEMKKLTATYLGNLPSNNRKETWKNVGVNFPKGVIIKELKRGKAPKSLIEIDFHGDFDYGDDQGRYNFYSLMDLLRIKMRESMREEKGGVYGVRVSGRAQQFPEEKYTITISFNSEPDKAEELIKTAMQDIKNAKENGAEEKDLTKVKETQKQGRIKNLKENRFWMSQLSTAYQNDLDPRRIGLKELEKLMEGLNSDAIKSAANKYFDESNMIKIVMHPEEEIEN